MLDRNILFGFLAGVIAGVVGAKIYSNNKEEINNKIKSFKDLAAVNHATATEEAETEGSDEATLEELEAQKERLEDLIAEKQTKLETETQA